ncbi:similar to Saccharomyces cerevisiae YDR397C NCB2 Subunit of a heterodimeric NC2 transcription regulator complex with Bur6p [Geotrichum candidum]|nr:similar to Saccharomyces cerevisiae YDR397C NCB2 Subunit of a heterodimeric NC2 transcription regulator complex with Bur6p [Geotrichum candidum]
MTDRDHGSDDLSLPKATVQKIISEIISPDLTFSRETRDALIECCIEFIMILSTESNDIAEKDSKKTIASEHVLEALETLGFYDYIDPIKKVIQEHKETQRVRERKVGLVESSGRTEEELLKEQEMLMAIARSKLNNSHQ